MSDKVYIGNKIIDLNTSPEYVEISRVRVVVSESMEYSTGTDEGRTIEIQCQWGTQEMANNLLASLSGYAYRPYDAETAYEADPLWELGDGVTVHDLYSQIADETINFSAAYTADFSAPNSEEIEHEYPYVDKGRQEIKREIARSAASLKIDIDAIEAVVTGIAKPYESGTAYAQYTVVFRDGKYYMCTAAQSSTTWVPSEWEEQSSGALSSIIKQTMDSITLSAVSGNNRSTVTITANGITVDSAVVQFSTIVADVVDAHTSVVSPYIFGGTYYDLNGNSEIDITSTNSYYNLLFGATPVSGVSDASFAIRHDLIGGADDLYLAGINVLRASESVDRAIFNTNLWLNKNLILSSYSYGTLAQMPDTGYEGQVYFVI